MEVSCGAALKVGQRWPIGQALSIRAGHDVRVEGDTAVDSVARWLLRIGIDQTGRLALTALWDVASRAAIAADLHQTGRLIETDREVHVDPEVQGLAYEDAACDDLLSSRFTTEAHWIRDGRVRARSVAEELITCGEWSRRLALTVPGGALYRAPRVQHAALRKRIAHVYDRRLEPRAESEAAVAVLGHALNVVRPVGTGIRDAASDDPLEALDCGSLAGVVEVAIVEIAARRAMSTANPNPTW